MKNVQIAKEQGLLTELEAKIMDWFLTEGLYAEKHFSDVWVDDIARNIEVGIKIVRGSVGSLVKKGYLHLEEMEEGEKPFVYATEKGFKLDDDYEEKYNDGDVWISGE
jgi:predicted DNA-binding transcriptional regulator